jgi:hypothetical protein
MSKAPAAGSARAFANRHRKPIVRTVGILTDGLGRSSASRTLLASAGLTVLTILTAMWISSWVELLMQMIRVSSPRLASKGDLYAQRPRCGLGATQPYRQRARKFRPAESFPDSLFPAGSAPMCRRSMRCPIRSPARPWCHPPRRPQGRPRSRACGLPCKKVPAGQKAVFTSNRP